SAEAFGTSARCAVLLDVQSGRFLYEREPQTPMLIASTTKMMTALVVLKNARLGDVVTVAKAQTGVEGSSMYLREGERLTVRELLYGLLLSSGNDAAEALAVHCAGDIPAFAELMNAQARELGLIRSHFANPHGLNANQHYSCARDLALIAREAMQNPDFRQIVSTKTINMAGRALQNHNKLLWSYEGAIGVKTGYTIKAGRCLVSAAERDGRMLIAVTLNDPDDWLDHAALFDEAFARYETRTLCAADAVVGQTPVLSGEARTVSLRARDTLTLPLTEEEWARVQTELDLPWYVWAPVARDAAAGHVRYLLDGKLLCQTELYYGEDVPEYVSETKSFWQALTDFFARRQPQKVN
ncbi:MAG: D-alanyl-D-alanine carboxypeptidase, partial [Oscillospiraceae bacterium]|nr:D-alanyl-D-alanine carboxypeptidase [Oscillospiraceae bacterium]